MNANRREAANWSALCTLYGRAVLIAVANRDKSNPKCSPELPASCCGVYNGRINPIVDRFAMKGLRKPRCEHLGYVATVSDYD